MESGLWYIRSKFRMACPSQQALLSSNNEIYGENT
jgi:hypothetical protein